MEESIKVSNIPKEYKPREKLLKYGSNFLTDEELLAIILRTGNKEENVLELSKRILNEIGGIHGLLNCSVEEFMTIKGIKSAKATQILSVCEIYKRLSKPKDKRLKVRKPSDIISLIMTDIFFMEQEIFMVITLNSKNNVLSKKEIFKGSLNSSLVHPREVFKEALKNSAASIIICHNHPSGDPCPSKEDINVTKRIKECGNIMGIELLDHIIIGDNNYISLKEKGYL